MNRIKQMKRPVSSITLACFIFVLFFLLIPAALFPYDLEKRAKKITLDNGLTVLMLERRTSPTVSLYIRHRVGAVDEAKGSTGAAHFLEHLMFKGTKTIGAKNYPAERKILRDIYRIGTLLDQE